MYNANKSNWYFKAISLKESSRIELSSNAYQIISFPTPVVTFSTLILLDKKKGKKKNNPKKKEIIVL
jgi:hypothetical protein